MRSRPSGRVTRAKGRLLVAPDAVVFDPCGRGRAIGKFGHAASTITITTVRLAPPWANTFLMLENRSGRIRLAVSVFARRGLARALRETDLTVRELRSPRPPQVRGR